MDFVCARVCADRLHQRRQQRRLSKRYMYKSSARASRVVRGKWRSIGGTFAVVERSRIRCAITVWCIAGRAFDIRHSTPISVAAWQGARLCVTTAVRAIRATCVNPLSRSPPVFPSSLLFPGLPKWWLRITRVMCGRRISARTAIISGRREERERRYAKPTAWATRRVSTARRRWKAGFSNGRTTWKVINGDGSSCQTASCRTTGSFLRVLRTVCRRPERYSLLMTRLYLCRVLPRRSARTIDLDTVASRSHATDSG